MQPGDVQAQDAVQHLVGTLLGLLSLLLCQVSVLLGLAQAPFQFGGNLHGGYYLILHPSLGRLQLLGQLHTHSRTVTEPRQGSGYVGMTEVHLFSKQRSPRLCVTVTRLTQSFHGSGCDWS